MCQGLVVFYPRCSHTHCPRSSNGSTCNPKPKPTYDILASTVQLCPPCYRKEEIAILTLYTIAINGRHDRKAERMRTLATAGTPMVGKSPRAYVVEIANLKMEMVDRLTELRAGQGVPKTPETTARVKFDSRGPQIVQVENWLGKENLWPDSDGDIEMKNTE